MTATGRRLAAEGASYRARRLAGINPAAVSLAERAAKAVTLRPIRTEVRQAHGGTLTLHFFAEFSSQPT